MSRKASLLIVEDDRETLKQLEWAFSKFYKVFKADNPKRAIELFEVEKPKVVLLDISLSADSEEKEGLALLEKFLSINPITKVIIVTGHDEDKTAIKAIRLGATDYYVKPIKPPELRAMVERAFHIANIELKSIANSRRKLEENRYGDIIGSCPEIKKVFNFIDSVAKTDTTVLILGESGTGKELVAKAIHEQSHRKDKPFVVINCSAIPENLLESELFGHEKGSFTGAYSQKKGKFELAEDGTIFFDEIGEIPPILQVKLLRFLQEKEFERVGGTKKYKVNARIIVATNRDLKKEMEMGNFREDLYYRLNVVSITLPPLRERGRDVILIARYLVDKYCEENKIPPKSLSREAELEIRKYNWPGNIRELENLIKRAVIMSPSNVIFPDALGFDQSTDSREILTLKEAKEEIERKYLLDALQRNKGFISRAAKDLGVSRGTFYDLLKKHNIEIDEEK
ncbi:MAG: PEP-CTERM-box response regulator transcription factor [Candidatus Schekmanbacteria bacterium]|nr:MAG: PEP-CTERM-box response regulator transcription factor [Candidatus Schekmanbacteria bacterium]